MIGGSCVAALILLARFGFGLEKLAQHGAVKCQGHGRNDADQELGFGKLYLREPVEYQNRDEAGTGEASSLAEPSRRGPGCNSEAEELSDHILTFLS
jgi:hypothetical protein